MVRKEKEKIIIIVPIYKEDPDIDEQFSFLRLLSVLKKYPICIVTYFGCSLKFYKNEAKKHEVELLVEYFDKSYFSSIDGYNKLCLSTDFYARFLQYSFMLIYQLDALVFHDEIDFWCKKNYDYIGAPWFEDNGSWEKGNKLWAVGNGGFSLRKTKTFYNLFKQNKRIFGFWKSIKAGIKAKKARVFFEMFGVRFLDILESWHDAEDLFFCLRLRGTKIQLHVPCPEEAALFSIERSPDYFLQNSNKLPFGCHKWSEYYSEFWMKEKNKI